MTLHQRDMVAVMAAPLFDPGAGRINVQMAPGSTVTGIVLATLPKASARELDHVRVVLVSDRGRTVIPRDRWHLVKPKLGIKVVIRIVPGKDALRSILQIVVSIAAIAIGQLWAVPFAGLSLAATQSLVTLGVTVIGNLLINALVPPPQPPSGTEQKATFSISGWKNPYTPNGVVPDVLGKHRFAPPFAALSYTEIVGDEQYIRTIFNCGYGPLALSDFRLGETSLEDYDEVETVVRSGLPSDGPITLYPRQIVEEAVGAELSRPLPRDDLGELIDDGVGVATPVIRSTGADAKGASIIVAFAGGLCEMSNEGKKKTLTCDFRIRQRLAGATEWVLVDTLSVTAKKLEGFYRQYSWDFAVRGRYEIELTRLRDEDTDPQLQSRSTWLVLQTLRPEYPLNFKKPMALVGLRIKATYQLQGALDSFNCIAERICPDWNVATGTWITRKTSNPASLYRYVLQSKANARPVTDAGIDLVELQAWHEFCTAKGLKYDRVIDFSAKLREILIEIAAAGRASPRHDGIKWSVVIDRPQALPVIDHVSPRNSYQFSSSRTYIDPPHGFRVSFLDATNDYKPAERLVRWPGYVGDITLTEKLELPGKTDPAEVWREARRRMYEVLYRPDTYSVIQDGQARVATRGDKVMASFDVLDRVQVAARVKSTIGRMIEIDELVTMETGGSYAIRFKHYTGDDDQIGTSVIRTVSTIAGEWDTLTLTGSGAMPLSGDLILFGAASSESMPLIVTGVEAGKDFSGIYRMVDASPIIDELTDAEVPPAWTGRVGAEIDENVVTPAAPRFVSIETGKSGTSTINGISITIEPGGGLVPAKRITVEHRISGAWSAVTFPAGNGGVNLGMYAKGDVVQLRAYAVSAAAVPGPPTPTITVTVGAKDPSIPGALNDDDVSIVAMPGAASIMLSTTDDATVRLLQVYRSTSTVLNRATDAVDEPHAVLPSRSYTFVDGDMTRKNLLSNGSFDSGASWTTGTGWSIGSGLATHVAGTGAAITQARAFTAGKFYRIAFEASGITAGNVKPRISGGSDRDGVGRTINGSFSDRVQAVTGNNIFGFVASADFAGSIDNVLLFLETATSLDAGTYYYFLEPQNSDGVPGPVSGPFAVTIK